LAERNRCREIPCGQDERQIEENERHLVGEIMHAVHNEAQTVGLKSGNRFHHENRGVECGGCGERLAIMGHGICRLLIRKGLDELLPARYHSATDDALQGVRR
jgi:hypothetical protein